MRASAVLVLVAFGGAVQACAQSPRPTAVRVADAWVRSQGDITGMSAGYFTIQNTGTSPVVVRSVSCRNMRMVTMHETQVTNGMARMVGRDSVTVPAGGQVVMRPGALHLMLMGLAQPLNVGERATCTVTTSAGDIPVTAAIRAS